MNRKDIYVGFVGYYASLEFFPNESTQRVLVKEMTIKMIGKKNIEIVGTKSGRYYGHITTYDWLIAALQKTKEGAVDYLERSVQLKWERTHATYLQRQKEAEEDSHAIAAWREGNHVASSG